MSGLSLWCPQRTPKAPEGYTTRDLIEQAWFRCAATLGQTDPESYHTLLHRTGNLVFPTHLVGALGDMRHPAHIEEEIDDELPEDNFLYESLAHTYVIGKKRGWTL